MFERFDIAEPERCAPPVTLEPEAKAHLTPKKQKARPCKEQSKSKLKATNILPPDQERFLRDREVADRLGICRQEVWRRVKIGRLPDPVKLSEKTTRWRLSELIAFESAFSRKIGSGVKRTPHAKVEVEEGTS